MKSESERERGKEKVSICQPQTNIVCTPSSWYTYMCVHTDVLRGERLGFFSPAEFSFWQH